MVSNEPNQPIDTQNANNLKGDSFYPFIKFLGCTHKDELLTGFVTEKQKERIDFPTGSIYHVNWYDVTNMLIFPLRNAPINQPSNLCHWYHGSAFKHFQYDLPTRIVPIKSRSLAVWICKEFFFVFREDEFRSGNKWHWFLLICCKLNIYQAIGTRLFQFCKLNRVSNLLFQLTVVVNCLLNLWKNPLDLV